MHPIDWSSRTHRVISLVLIFMLAFMVAPLVHAQTATTNAVLKFTVPTTHTDGSPITGALTYSALYGAKGSTLANKTRFATAVKPDGSVSIPNMPWGTCFQVVASELQSGNVAIDGAPTNEACLPFPPNGATNLTVTVSIVISSP